MVCEVGVESAVTVGEAAVVAILRGEDICHEFDDVVVNDSSVGYGTNLVTPSGFQYAVLTDILRI